VLRPQTVAGSEILEDGDLDHEPAEDGRLEGEFTTDQRLYIGRWEGTSTRRRRSEQPGRIRRV